MWSDTSQLIDLKREVKGYAERLTALETAFDELFDAVAQDLGYEAVQNVFYGYAGNWSTVTHPRRLTKTAPVSEVVRKKTKRCK